VSGGSWRTIAGLELRTQLQGAPFWILLIVLALLVGSVNPTAMLPTGSATIGGLQVAATSAHALASSFALSAFFAYPFFACMMAALCVVRDEELGMRELLHSTPLRPSAYLLGKLAGIAATLGLAMLWHLAGMVLLRELPAVLGSAPLGSPFAVWNYVLPLALVVAPGVLFVATVAFVVGAFTRRTMAAYAVPVLYSLAVLMLLWTWSPPGLPHWFDQLLMVIDPSGLRWMRRSLFLVDHGVAYYNAAPLALNALFWGSRVVALALPAILVAILVRSQAARRPLEGGRSTRSLRTMFRRLASGRTEPGAGSPSRGAQGPPLVRFGALADLDMRQSSPSTVRGAWVVAWAELRAMWRQPACWLFTALLMFVVVEAGVSGDDISGAPVLLTAGTLAVRTIPVVTVLVCLFLLFIVVELMHRDTATGFAPLANAAPVGTAAILLGRLASVMVLSFVLMAACAAATLPVLLGQPGGGGALWPLGLVYGAVLLPSFLLWSSFVVALMTAVRSRTAGLGVGMLALLGTGALFLRGEMTWVTNWLLWGALRWTDFGVFPLNGSPLLLNRMLALALAVLLWAVSMALFPRIERDAVGSARRRQGPQRLRASLKLAPFALAPVLIGGFLAVDIEQGWQGTAEQDRAERYFRENAVAWSGAVPLVIRTIDVSLELDPAARTLAVEGWYTMVNESDAALDRFALTVGRTHEPVRWTMDGRVALADDRSGLLVLTPGQPLAPGAELTVGFSYAATHPFGPTRNGGGAGTFIVPSGALLSTRGGLFLPVPGFVDDQSETRYGDPVLPGAGFNGGHTFQSRLRVRAPDAFIVNSVGTRTLLERADGYTTVYWQSDEPVGAINLIAGRWQVAEREGVSVHFLPAHTRNVNEMLATMQAARTRFSQWFMPYPWPELRLSEYPDLETNATAFPSNISFSEGIGFLTGGPPEDALAFSVVAHEVAHQWWGHLVAAGEGPGTGWLVEGMANYATLLLHDAEHGSEARARFARQLEQNYLDQRAVREERPLLATLEGAPGDEAVLAHRGALVLWMLRQSLGAPAMEDALRRYVTEHRDPQRQGTPAELLATLRQAATAPLAFDDLVREWLAGTALPEYQLSAPPVVGSGGSWRTVIEVRNVGTGSPAVDVVMVAAAPAGGGLPASATRRVVVGPGQKVRLVLDTPFAPERVTVDPDVHVLQLNRDRARLELTGIPRLGAGLDQGLDARRGAPGRPGPY